MNSEILKNMKSTAVDTVGDNGKCAFYKGGKFISSQTTRIYWKDLKVRFGGEYKIINGFDLDGDPARDILKIQVEVTNESDGVKQLFSSDFKFFNAEGRELSGYPGGELLGDRNGFDLGINLLPGAKIKENIYINYGILHFPMFVVAVDDGEFAVIYLDDGKKDLPVFKK